MIGRRIVFESATWRVVEVDPRGRGLDRYVFEHADGKDAMGVNRWRKDDGESLGLVLELVMALDTANGRLSSLSAAPS